jgi:hypothetical protein
MPMKRSGCSGLVRRCSLPAWRKCLFMSPPGTVHTTHGAQVSSLNVAIGKTPIAILRPSILARGYFFSICSVFTTLRHKSHPAANARSTHAQRVRRGHLDRYGGITSAGNGTEVLREVRAPSVQAPP